MLIYIYIYIYIYMHKYIDICLYMLIEYKHAYNVYAYKQMNGAT